MRILYVCIHWQHENESRHPVTTICVAGERGAMPHSNDTDYFQTKYYHSECLQGTFCFLEITSRIIYEN